MMCFDPDESVPLTTSNEKPHMRRMLGTDVECDDEEWHYVLVFPIIKADDTRMVWRPQNVLSDILRPRYLNQWTDWRLELPKDHEGMPLRDLQKLIWQHVVKLLSGTRCGFKVAWRESIDKDEVFLLIGLTNQTALERLAHRQGLRLQSTEQAYKVAGYDAPVLTSLGGRPQAATAYLPYSRTAIEEFERAKKARLDTAERSLQLLMEEVKVLVPGKELDRTDPTTLRLRKFVLDEFRKQDTPRQIMAKLIEKMDAPSSEEESRLMDFIFDRLSREHEKLDDDMKLRSEKLYQQQANGKAKLKAYRLEYWRKTSVGDLQDAELFREFREIDRVRIVEQRITTFVDLDKAVDEGVLSSHFPVHRSLMTEQLSRSWANPLLLCQWPGEKHQDEVRDYFGEEVAFFFHWLAYFTRMLFLPGIGSLVLMGSKHFLRPSHETWERMELAFALMMCVWSTIFHALYNQRCNQQIRVWGMEGFSRRDRQLPYYDYRLRGSALETLTRLLHWILFAIVVCETLYVVFTINRIALSDRKMMRIYFFMYTAEVPRDVAEYYAPMILTLNIKFIDRVWAFLSPRVTRKENWKTFQQEEDAAAKKMFVMKCIVYYYPFFNLAFIQPYTRRWVPAFANLPRSAIVDQCKQELREQLISFIIFQLVTMLATSLLNAALSWYKVRKEVASSKNSERYTYIQLQAKLPEYAGDSADYLEFVATFGFICMFTVACPLMAFLCLVTFLLEKRVLAYQMLQLTRRPPPRGQEGIGVWLNVSRDLSFAACATNAGIVCFIFNPLDWDFAHSLLAFVVAEHVLFFAMYLIGSAVPEKSVQVEILEEKHTDFVEHVNSVEHEKEMLPRAELHPVQDLSSDPDLESWRAALQKPLPDCLRDIEEAT